MPSEMLRRGRGRPHGKRQSIADLTNRWYLIRIAEKYELETLSFLDCFLDAWKNGNSSCDGISIQCRQRVKDNGIFLIMQDQKIIAQLSLNEESLKHLSEVDITSFPWNQLTTNKDSGNLASDMQIKDVDANVRWVNLKGNVVNKSVIRKVHSKYGTSHRLSTATISDKTGSIKLPLWNAQIERISVGDEVQIEHGRVRMFRGELQVSVGKSGKINVTSNR